MKIGILTFHRAINYGAVLQCFALSKCLTNMGHQVSVLDYRPESIERYRKIASFLTLHDKSLFTKIKLFGEGLLNYPTNHKLIRKFDHFLKTFLPISKNCYSLKNISCNSCDLVIIGSDQIWNKKICYGLDPVYWGQFKHASQSICTYAASFAVNIPYNKDENDRISGYLNAFDHVSVREQSLKDYLKFNFNQESKVVCDPTLLLGQSDYDSMAIMPNVGKYILIYIVEPEAYTRAVEIAVSLAKKYDCGIRLLSAYPVKEIINTNVKIVDGISPEEFVGYFKCAHAVVAASFHATAFSIIYNKNLYVVSTPKKDRAYNLLNLLGIPERMIDNASSIDFSEIDYASVNKRLDALRKSSYDYLKLITSNHK